MCSQCIAVVTKVANDVAEGMVLGLKLVCDHSSVDTVVTSL